MELTTYQKDILNYFNTYPKKNMYISAKAGCGKSFIASQMLKDTSAYSVYVAFNSSIAQEMRTKINNPKVKIYTMHALCRAVLLYNLQEQAKEKPQATGGFGIKKEIANDKVDTFKIQELLRKEILIGKEYKDYEQNGFLTENYTQLYNLVRLKLIDLTHPQKASGEIKALIKENNLFMDSQFSEPSLTTICDIIEKLDELSLKAFEEQQSYDFTDMLYITLRKLQTKEWEIPFWASFYNVVVDEAQDLSPIQLILLLYFKRKNGRYIFILDPKQAIYAFSGADSNSFRKIKYLYAPIKEFDLPINYRCAVSHLNYVNQLYAIGIQPCDTAPQGSIKKTNINTCLNLAKSGDFIVGRKNKWLIPIILGLIKRGKPVYIKDESFVKDIVSFIKKTKVEEIDLFQRKLQNMRKKLKEKVEERLQEEQSEEEDIELNTIQEAEIDSNEIERITIVLDLIKNFKKEHSTNSKKAFLSYVETILNTKPTKECIIVSSIHCVKGLEATNVFILNEGKPVTDGYMSIEQKQQEYNLSYVSLTRAKENLYLVKAEGNEYN